MNQFAVLESIFVLPVVDCGVGSGFHHPGGVIRRVGTPEGLRDRVVESRRRIQFHPVRRYVFPSVRQRRRVGHQETLKNAVQERMSMYGRVG